MKHRTLTDAAGPRAHQRDGVDLHEVVGLGAVDDKPQLLGGGVEGCRLREGRGG